MSGPSRAAPVDLTRLSGLELLSLGMTPDGPDRPPTIGRLLGMTLEHVSYGEVGFRLTTQPLFANPLGTTHGGICATMLDSALGCAVHSTLVPGAWYTTLELKVNYVRAVPTDGRVLTAVGRTLHVGRTIATAEGTVHDEHQRLVAHATTTCLIRTPTEEKT